MTPCEDALELSMDSKLAKFVEGAAARLTRDRASSLWIAGFARASALQSTAIDGGHEASYRSSPTGHDLWCDAGVAFASEVGCRRARPKAAT